MSNRVFFDGVSICLFTYNYERYLEQALESILLQKVNFKIEVVLGDDYSTDKTRDIAIKYQQRHPDIFILSFNSKNIGGTKNWIKTINQCSGKYIALLDGDDYFTDCLKLQKQYDQLENNSNLVLSFHSVEEKYDNVNGNDTIIEFEESYYKLKDIFQKGWFIRTGSTFFRNGIIPKTPPEWVYDFPYRYDTIIHVYLGLYGDFGNIKQSMSVWRKHQKGMSYALREKLIKSLQEESTLLIKLNEITDGQYTKEVNEFSSRNYSRIKSVKATKR